MRNLFLLDQFRRRDRHVIKRFGGVGDETCGVFEVPSPIDGGSMMIIASSGGGWEHVSVSRKNRCPNWPEMSHVKHLFFKDNETVVQYHVPSANHVNDHPNCLHLWRPTNTELPRPPGWMVGGVSDEEAQRLAAEAGA